VQRRLLEKRNLAKKKRGPLGERANGVRPLNRWGSQLAPKKKRSEKTLKKNLAGVTPIHAEDQTQAPLKNKKETEGNRCQKYETEGQAIDGIRPTRGYVSLTEKRWKKGCLKISGQKGQRATSREWTRGRNNLDDEGGIIVK